VLRVVVLAGLILSSPTVASGSGSLAWEGPAETATACLRYVRKLSLLGPELVCLHSGPDAASRQKTVT
jgi:hypothetical protein